jgi:PAS domain S-box-containing protein
MFGYTKTEALGQSPAIIHQPGDIPRLQDEIIAEVQANRRWTGEIRYRRKDGESGICEAVVVPVSDSSGKIISTVGVNRDITERKRAEEALRASEALNRAIIEHAPLGISVRSPTGQLLSYNETWRMIWAMPEQVTQEDLTRCVQRWILTTETITWANIYRDQACLPARWFIYISELHPTRRRPGAAEWISQYFYAIQGNSGKVTQVIILTEDITREKQHERELRGVANISQSLRTTHTRSDMLPIILAELTSILGCGSGLIALSDETTGETIIELATGRWSGISRMRLSPEQNIFNDITGPKQCYTVMTCAQTRITFSHLISGDYATAAVPLVAKITPLARWQLDITLPSRKVTLMF